MGLPIYQGCTKHGSTLILTHYPHNARHTSALAPGHSRSFFAPLLPSGLHANLSAPLPAAAALSLKEAFALLSCSQHFLQYIILYFPCKKSYTEQY